jgi:hypothetical protein
MTRNPHPTPSRQSRESLFRPGAHVAAVHCGSALAILDLERGTLHAASPDGTDAWASLVECLQTQARAESDAPEVPASDESRALMAWVADYLLERCLIELRKGGAGEGKSRRAT